MIILSDDPAPKNYGRALLDVTVHKKSIRFCLKKAWLVSHTIRNEDIKGDYKIVIKTYKKSVRRMIKKYGPVDGYCAERFMARMSTVQGGESVSMMLAINTDTLSSSLPDIYCRIIPAVTWKTQLKRYFDLKELYKLIKPCPDHLLDATFIGLYLAYVKHEIKPFSTLKVSQVNKLVKQLKAVGETLKTKEKEAKRKAKEERNNQ